MAGRVGQMPDEPQDLTPPGPIAYLAPEFPGQTATWIWREVVQMREFGTVIRLFSTRPPQEDSAARHTFAEQARDETIYVWPRPLRSVLTAVGWAALKRPRRLLHAATAALALDRTSLRERMTALALVAAACVFSREATARGIRHVHVHSAGRSALIAMLTRRLVGIPYSIALNSHLDAWGGGMGSKLGQAAFTVVNAQWLLDDVRREYPQLRPAQVLLARPGVDTQSWAPASGGRRTADSTFRLVTVGRLHHGKGHDVTIRAIARLRDNGQTVHLTIVGAGPELNSLQALVDQLDLQETVGFTGSISENDVMALMGAADAFVLASRFEPLGVVYMEAMALAVPTIGTDAGGVGDIITNEYDGLLVPADDEHRLAAAIQRLLEDPALRRRLGENARKTVVERFDSRIGAEKLYERLFGAVPRTT
jgi:colanic acid/amylovoran biosynthesis glycosyltransferase